MGILRKYTLENVCIELPGINQRNKDICWYCFLSSSPSVILDATPPLVRRAMFFWGKKSVWQWAELSNCTEVARLFGVNATLTLKHAGVTGKFRPERSLTAAAIIFPRIARPLFLEADVKESALKCNKQNKNLFHVKHSVCFVVCSARPRTLFSLLPQPLDSWLPMKPF